MASADVFKDIHCKEVNTNKGTITAMTASTDVFKVKLSGSDVIAKISTASDYTPAFYLYDQVGNQIFRVTSAGIVFGTSLNAASCMQLTSTTKAFNVPIMTNTQRDTISTPLSGAMVYTALSGLCVYGGKLANTWNSIFNV